ncbi:hypothetical protein [Candidatus Laterigemmans baculatus]|uniref:hypothetical protein n=1 Tax=Candidatus Laterigemmans baculatus TaxID=2770505 RepID=UPI0013D90591|nr:hypothetical protein [Candidatus Laterigemmans baculatus]
MTAEQVAGKINQMPRRQVPIAGNHLTAFIDVQQKLLFYVVAAWEDDFTGYRNWECIYFNFHWSSKAEDYGRRFLRVTNRREKIETRHKLLNHIHSQFRGAVEEFLAAKFPSPSPVETAGNHLPAVENTASMTPLVTA